MAGAPSAPSARLAAGPSDRGPRSAQVPSRRRGLGRRERPDARRIHGRGTPLALPDGGCGGPGRRACRLAARPGGARRLRPRGASSIVGPRPHADPRRAPGGSHPVRPAHGPGDPLPALGPGAPGRARVPLARRLPGDRAHRPAEPHLHAGGPGPGRRTPAPGDPPADASSRGLPEGLRGVPRPDAGRARRALPEARRDGLPPGAQHQGVGGRSAGRPHRPLARLGALRRPDPPGA